jgi:hypothetical protein
LGSIRKEGEPLTTTQEARVLQGILKTCIERKLGGVECWRSTSKMSNAASEEEVVREGNAMAGGDLVDFMLAVTVERCPLDLCRSSLVLCGPVEDDILTRSAGIADSQLAALVG